MHHVVIYVSDRAFTIGHNYHILPKTAASNNSTSIHWWTNYFSAAQVAWCKCDSEIFCTKPDRGKIRTPVLSAYFTTRSHFVNQ